MPVTTRKVKSSSKTLKEELEQKEVNDILDLVEKTCSKTRKRSRTPMKNSAPNSENTETATKSNNSNEKSKEIQPHSKKLPASPAIRKSSKEKFEADHQPVAAKNRRKLVKTEDYSGGTVHGFGGYNL